MTCWVIETSPPTPTCHTLADRCVAGITATTEHLRRSVEHSIGVITALNPHIGYTAATGIAAEALVSGRSILSLVVARELLTEAEPAEILSPENLVRPVAPAER